MNSADNLKKKNEKEVEAETRRAGWESGTGWRTQERTQERTQDSGHWIADTDTDTGYRLEHDVRTRWGNYCKRLSSCDDYTYNRNGARAEKRH